MTEIKLQQVVDLTCLIRNDRAKVQAALCDEEFKSPFLFCLACALEPKKKTNWVIRYMQKKTAAASSEDLYLVERALQKKKIPYEMTLRNQEQPKISYVCSREHFNKVLNRIALGIGRT